MNKKVAPQISNDRNKILRKVTRPSRACFLLFFGCLIDTRLCAELFYLLIVDSFLYFMIYNCN